MDWMRCCGCAFVLGSGLATIALAWVVWTWLLGWMLPALASLVA